MNSKKKQFKRKELKEALYVRPTCCFMCQISKPWSQLKTVTKAIREAHPNIHFTSKFRVCGGCLREFYRNRSRRTSPSNLKMRTFVSEVERLKQQFPKGSDDIPPIPNVTRARVANSTSILKELMRHRFARDLPIDEPELDDHNEEDIKNSQHQLTTLTASPSTTQLDPPDSECQVLVTSPQLISQDVQRPVVAPRLTEPCSDPSIDDSGPDSDRSEETTPIEVCKASDSMPASESVSISNEETANSSSSIDSHGKDINGGPLTLKRVMCLKVLKI